MEDKAVQPSFGFSALTAIKSIIYSPDLSPTVFYLYVTWQLFPFKVSAVVVFGVTCGILFLLVKKLLKNMEPEIKIWKTLYKRKITSLKQIFPKVAKVILSDKWLCTTC